MPPTRQRSFRFSHETLDSLERRARERGESGSRLAERLVEEGLRMDTHPGIVFRDGPTGRRAALAAGPDVWELARFFTSLDVRGASAVNETAAMLNLAASQVESALRYYADYPEEIDDRIGMDDDVGAREEATWRRQQAIMG